MSELNALVAYVPAPHNGYLGLFRKYPDHVLFVLGSEFLNQHMSLVRHLPGNSPEDAATMIRSLNIFDRVEIATPANIQAIMSAAKVVMPDEEVSRTFSREHLAGKEVVFDPSWRLRWDWGASTKKNVPVDSIAITQDEFHRGVMSKAADQAARSPDWWRQVGAAFVRDGEILLVAYNTHLPSEQTAYLEGDPRSNFGPGVSIDVSVAQHAEMAILAQAARRGITTDGGSLYVTTFPCPGCANAWSESGIRHLYFREGYSLVAGEATLRSKGIEITRVI